MHTYCCIFYGTVLISCEGGVPIVKCLGHVATNIQDMGLNLTESCVGWTQFSSGRIVPRPLYTKETQY